jgi:REP element-mobilizing transposase RayT
MRQPNAIKQVHNIVYKTAKKHGVTIYKFSNSGNHLHLGIKLTKLMCWKGFIREVSGRIASLMRKLKITGLGESFWLHRPFTRIVRGWKKAFKILLDYIELNILEAEGHISRKDTKTLKDLNAIWGDP